MEHYNKEDGFIKFIALSTVDKYEAFDLEKFLDVAFDKMIIDKNNYDNEKNDIKQQFTQIVKLSNSDELFQKGVHPNQWYLESIFGKPTNLKKEE